MGYGPYRYVNGQKLTYGSDGRWWLVTKSYGGNDYGYPTSGPSVHHRHSVHASAAAWQASHHRYQHHANAVAQHVSVPKGASTGGAPDHVEDPDDLRIRQLATAISGQAGWIGTGKGIAAFYGASLVGAGIMVGAPMAGAAISESLMGPAEGRIFYESWRFTRPMVQELIDSGVGRAISSSPLGAWIESVVGYEGFLSKIGWQVASMLWASGAGGAISIVMTDDPNDASYFFLYEAPRLFANPYVFLPFRYFVVRK